MYVVYIEGRRLPEDGIESLFLNDKYNSQENKFEPLLTKCYAKVFSDSIKARQEMEEYLKNDKFFNKSVYYWEVRKINEQKV